VGVPYLNACPAPPHLSLLTSFLLRKKTRSFSLAVRKKEYIHSHGEEDGHGRRRRLDHGEVPPLVDPGPEPARGGPRGRGVLPRRRGASPRCGPGSRAAAAAAAAGGGRGRHGVRGVHGGDRGGGPRRAAAVRALVPPRLHRAVARDPDHLPPLPRRGPAPGGRRRRRGGRWIGPREAACPRRIVRRATGRVTRGPRRRCALRTRLGRVKLLLVGARRDASCTKRDRERSG
jgi:hypothetical protein